ncbi:unnamed protein product [Arctia plantaginis]|uniref:Uncharacterized protein n=1 Tax=Arctia plantaginis TaxID=874455 RepID=A0A8S0YZV8_ARCPL|nr:unnamed protein product [Arctia plantaginis]
MVGCQTEARRVVRCHILRNHASASRAPRASTLVHTPAAPGHLPRGIMQSDGNGSVLARPHWLGVASARRVGQ